MEQSLTREADSSIGSQEIPYIEWNPKTAICPCTKPHASSPWCPVLLLCVAHQYHPVNARSSKQSLSFRFSNQNQAFLIFLMHTTCPAFIILTDMIIPIIFCEEYKSSGPLLCSFIQLSVTCSLLGSSIPLSTRFSNGTLIICVFIL